MSRVVIRSNRSPRMQSTKADRDKLLALAHDGDGARVRVAVGRLSAISSAAGSHANRSAAARQSRCLGSGARDVSRSPSPHRPVSRQAEGEFIAWLRRHSGRPDRQSRPPLFGNQAARRPARASPEHGTERHVVYPGPRAGRRHESPSEQAVRREAAVQLANALEHLAGRLSPSDHAAAFGRAAVRRGRQRMGRSVDSVEKLWVRALGSAADDIGRGGMSRDDPPKFNPSARRPRHRPASQPSRSSTTVRSRRGGARVSGGWSRANRYAARFSRPASRHRRRTGPMSRRAGFGASSRGRRGACPRYCAVATPQRARPTCRWAISASFARSAAAEWASSTRRCNCRWAGAWRVKVLPFAAALDSQQLQRFKNEAQAAAQLHHTNIVPVYAVGSRARRPLLRHAVDRRAAACR